MAVRLPSLRALAAFEAAARHGTFREAAQELNLTHSAVSHAVRSLEFRVGRPLFSRSRAGVRLTPEGRTLLARACVGLSLLGEVFELAPGRDRSRLAITVMPAFAERFLGARLGHYLRTEPRLRVEVASTPELVDLPNSDFDVGIRYGAGRWAGVRAQRIAATPLVAVASPAYRAGKLPRSAAALETCDLIEEGHTPWALALPKMSADQRDRRLRVDDLSFALCLAEAGVGIALAPSLLVRDSIAAGRLVRVTSLAAASTYGFWMVWKNSSDKQAAIAHFAEWLRREAQDGQQGLERVA